jgi:hypothetical protein
MCSCSDTQPGQIVRATRPGLQRLAQVTVALAMFEGALLFFAPSTATM